MKLISKQEPVKPVAPYIWGAKYLVLDSVPEGKCVKAGETVIVTSVWGGSFKAYSEHNYDYINPEHLQLIDPVPQAEHVPVTVDSAVVGKQYLLIAYGQGVPKGEIVTLAEIDEDEENVPFRILGSTYEGWFYSEDLAELPVEQTSETVYTVELTESELQGIVVGIGQSKHPDRVFSTKLNGFPEEVASISPKTYDEILNLLEENKQ